MCSSKVPVLALSLQGSGVTLVGALKGGAQRKVIKAGESTLVSR